MQRALIQYQNPENYAIVKEALLAAGREDLIGYGEKCLIPPRQGHGGRQTAGTGRTFSVRERQSVPGNKTVKGKDRHAAAAGKPAKKKKTIRNVHKKKKHGQGGRS